MVGAPIVFLENALERNVGEPTVVAVRRELGAELQFQVRRTSAQQSSCEYFRRALV
jgi:hypothetical protein